MPSISDKQARFMAIAAKDRKFAQKAGISQKVAQEWHEEDKRVGKVGRKKAVEKRYGK